MTPPGLTLIVEDDSRFRQRLARALASRGLEVEEADSLVTAREAIGRHIPARVILDLRLDEVWSLDFISELHALHPEVAVVVLTGYGSIATALEAVRRGARHYLTKPVDVDQILAAFEAGAEATASPDDPRPMSLGRLEWEHINRVLTECDGNVSEAARVLGLHRRSLQRKLAKYPLPR
jgi:two-component system, response regulator RegA